MAERRTIGQILMGFGRITEEDVARALAHQQEKGGYFGEALLALNLVSQEELEWSLASQFDLPYVFPEAESIDPEASALVTPEWALANLTLPIMRQADTVTVVVDSPIKTGAVDELQRRTGLKIELALASATKIRELVRQVFAKTDTAGEQVEAQPPVDFQELVSTAVERGGGAFGISVRGQRATGWFQERGKVRRRLLLPGWAEEMERDISPKPSERVDGKTRASWEAQVIRRGIGLPVEVQYMGGAAGSEYVFRPVEERPKVHDRFPPPSSAVLSEVKLLVGSGSARFAVSTEPGELLDELLPHLPALLLDPYWRSAHLADPGDAGGDDEIFRFEIPADPEGRKQALEGARSFRFDAVTASLGGPLATWADDVLDVAGVVFLPLRPGDEKAAEKVGIRWQLTAMKDDGGRLEWSLQPLG